jgi:FG-GAP-like repeat
MLRALFAALAVLATAASASAAVPRDGWGLGIADDSYLTPGARLPDQFRALGPKTFRLQIHWNAACTPGRIESARDWIAQARDLGAEQIAVTFKKNAGVDCGDPVNCGRQPSEACYAARIGEVVRALASVVDVWGPANEPNLGDTWLPGTEGARKLARYWVAFAGVLAMFDPTAQAISPEFADRSDRGSLAPYVNAYKAAGGGFGSYVGYHAYWGVHAMSRAPTDELAALTPPEAPIWITEVGAFGVNPSRSIALSDTEQAIRVDWMLNAPDGLANHPRVGRISYYHLQASSDAVFWDSALSRADGTPRPSWLAWCSAAHGGNAAVCQDGADAVALGSDGAVTVGRSTGNRLLGAAGWTGAPFRATQLADVTGDGRADAIAASADGVLVARSTGTSFGAPEPWASGPARGARVFADVTGDGRADAVAVDPTGIVVRRSAGDRLGPEERWSQSVVDGFGTTRFADVTGDGLADAVGIELGGVTVVRRSTGVGLGPREYWVPFFGPVSTHLADVTGDGLADAIAAGAGGPILVQPSSGNGFGAAQVWTESPFAGTLQTQFADVTGDRRADAIAITTEGAMIVRRSRGTHFLAPELWAGGYTRGALFGDVTRG